MILEEREAPDALKERGLNIPRLGVDKSTCEMAARKWISTLN